MMTNGGWNARRIFLHRHASCSARNEYHLGKHPKRTDARTLQLFRHRKPTMPAPAPKVDYTERVTSAWRMFLNDQLGDCTIAGALHIDMAWSAGAVTPTDGDALAGYEGACGYKDGDASTDRGGVILDVLNYWRTTGLGGVKIAAFAEVKPSNTLHCREAIEAFGALKIGLALPLSAQDQDTWDVVEGADGEPGSWGGHDVPILGYEFDAATGLYKVVTWGAPKQMTERFFQTYCDEAYAPLAKLWAPDDAKAPSGYDFASLTADLAAITG